jgi:hypothetical protein
VRKNPGQLPSAITFGAGLQPICIQALSFLPGTLAVR